MCNRTKHKAKAKGKRLAPFAVLIIICAVAVALVPSSNATSIQFSNRGLTNSQLLIYNVTGDGVTEWGVFNSSDLVEFDPAGAYIITTQPTKTDYMDNPASLVHWVVDQIPLIFWAFLALAICMIGAYFLLRGARLIS